MFFTDITLNQKTFFQESNAGMGRKAAGRIQVPRADEDRSKRIH
jgi:hypothetical protein